MHIERILPLDPGLFSKERFESRKPRVIRIFNGPKPYKARANVKHPDAVLLEIRRLAETEKLTNFEIVEHLAKCGLVLTYSAVHGIRDYTYRAMLVPVETSIPYWPIKG